MADGPNTPRAKARAAMVEDIKAAARRQVAEVGAPGLSVRLIARELGLSSSATYRYFASRDELLTALIVDGYAAQGAAVEAAEAEVPRDDFVGRFLAVARAIRRFAVERPHEYALLYGSPVPGYVAPEETIAEASRPTLLLVRVLLDAHAAGRLEVLGSALAEANALEPDLPEVLQGVGGLPDGALAQGVLIWSGIYGLVSFELFGHLERTVASNETFFDAAVLQLLATIGIS